MSTNKPVPPPPPPRIREPLQGAAANPKKIPPPLPPKPTASVQDGLEKLRDNLKYVSPQTPNPQNELSFVQDWSSSTPVTSIPQRPQPKRDCCTVNDDYKSAAPSVNPVMRQNVMRYPSPPKQRRSSTFDESSNDWTFGSTRSTERGFETALENDVSTFSRRSSYAAPEQGSIPAPPSGRQTLPSTSMPFPSPPIPPPPSGRQTLPSTSMAFPSPPSPLQRTATSFPFPPASTPIQKFAPVPEFPSPPTPIQRSPPSSQFPSPPSPIEGSFSSTAFPSTPSAIQRSALSPPSPELPRMDRFAPGRQARRHFPPRPGQQPPSTTKSDLPQGPPPLPIKPWMPASTGADADTQDSEFMEVKGNSDPYVTSPSVFGLSNCTFKQFISEKDISLVLFYDHHMISKDRKEKFAKKNFIKAAESMRRANTAFATVNCMQDQGLCQKEGAGFFPFYRMYSKGHTVGTFRDSSSIDYKTLIKFVENAPILSADLKVKRPCEK